jgi:hypothetical protein
MKTHSNFSAGIPNTRRLLSSLILVLLMISQSSCFKQFYQVNSTHKTDAITLNQLQARQKLFIIHTPGNAFALRDVKVEGETLQGYKFAMDTKYDRYLNPGAEKANPMARKDKKVTLNEVHLYTDSSFDHNDQVVLAISQIKRVDIYGKDKKANTESTVISAVGITVGVAAIIGLGAAAANSMSSGIPISIPLH